MLCGKVFSPTCLQGLRLQQVSSSDIRFLEFTQIMVPTRAGFL